MTDLVEFLRARLDDDEQAARAACWDDQSDVWTARPPQASYERYTVVDYLDDGVVAVTPENADAGGVGKHIARHDPARVLREVEAKRRVVDAYETAVAEFADSGPAMASYDRLTGSVSSLRHALALLALSYADHPDYRPGWKP